MSRLDDAMSRLAAEADAPLGVALEMERAVLAEFDRARGTASLSRSLSRRRGKVWMAAGAMAASVAVAWFVEHRPAPMPAAPPVVETEAEPPFVPIPYVLPPAPYERVQVVRMKLPVSELVAAGFRMQNADLGAQAEADVMVGQDGSPRAVRLISISSFN
jgi:hypothetical protein